ERLISGGDNPLYHRWHRTDGELAGLQGSVHAELGYVDPSAGGGPGIFPQPHHCGVLQHRAPAGEADSAARPNYRIAREPALSGPIGRGRRIASPGCSAYRNTISTFVMLSE